MRSGREQEAVRVLLRGGVSSPFTSGSVNAQDLFRTLAELLQTASLRDIGEIEQSDALGRGLTSYLVHRRRIHVEAVYMEDVRLLDSPQAVGDELSRARAPISIALARDGVDMAYFARRRGDAREVWRLGVAGRAIGGCGSTRGQERTRAGRVVVQHPGQ